MHVTEVWLAACLPSYDWPSRCRSLTPMGDTAFESEEASLDISRLRHRLRSAAVPQSSPLRATSAEVKLSS